MSMIEKIKNIPGRSAITFCAVVIAVFFFAGIVPAYRNNLLLSEKIRDARHRIEENNALQPLYRVLQGTPAGFSSELTVPEKVALQRTQIAIADANLRDIAGRAGMKVVSLIPDLSSFQGNVLAMNISLKGDFANVRTVLKKIGELPYVDHIDNFAIQRERNSRSIDITLRIMIAVS